MMSLPVWLTDPIFLVGRGSLFLVPCSFHGVSVQGGISVREIPPNRDPLPVLRRAGGTHPTGMLSYYQVIFARIIFFRGLSFLLEAYKSNLGYKF